MPSLIDQSSSSGSHEVHSLQPRASALQRLSFVARDIKLSHSLFAMPFALLATFYAAAHAEEPRLPRVVPLLLIIVCMFFARTVAMTFNRWADRRIDVDNPRTSKRAIPSGRVDARFMAMVTVVCALAFITATGGFWLFTENPWPLLLSPAVLMWLCLYSLTKRWTWLCHLFLGSALALSPVAAVIAVQPQVIAQPGPWLLAVMVMCWVAGFDIIYALQDVQTDRAEGLFSMPAKLGEENALWISRGLHLCSMIALLAFAWFSPMLDLTFHIAIAAVIGLLLIEHAIVWRSRIHHLNMVFFTLNGIISVLLGAAGIADLVRYVL